VEIVYLDHGVCSRCWNRYTAETQPADALARVLGVSMAAEAAEKEIAMEIKEKVETEDTSKPVKATKVKTARAAKAKVGKRSKAAKVAKPKKERKPKEENLMVFAFRLSKPESEALHAAAGPANASRTMRSLAAALAAEDADAFKVLVAEARKLRF
jgi:hypothetical protein